jgi:hypothetical protein
MITFFVTIATAMLYAWWMGKNTNWPTWMSALIGLIWGIIVVYSVKADCI